MGDLFERYARQQGQRPAPPMASPEVLQDTALVDEAKTLLEKMTKGQLDDYDFRNALATPSGDTPYSNYQSPKWMKVNNLLRWARAKEMLPKLIELARGHVGEKEQERKATASLYSTNLSILNRYFPEWRKVLEDSGGNKPRKFVEKVSALITPASWNPTGLGDFDMRHTYHYNGKTRQLRTGPMYSYDTMLNAARGSGLQDRTVELNPGDRFWDVIYSGQYGGYWHTVRVYISPMQQHQLGVTLLLGGK